MKQIALTIDQMKRLERLGLNIRDASMYYSYEGVLQTCKSYELTQEKFKEGLWIPAYTLQDILEKLPTVCWIEWDTHKKGHRVYNDIVNNPDLSISIVDKAFAFAQVYDSEFITPEHFIESFEYCDRIYETSRNQAIARLRHLNPDISKPTPRILKIDFNKNKK